MGPTGDGAGGLAAVDFRFDPLLVDAGATTLPAGFVSDSLPPVGSSLSWFWALAQAPATTRTTKNAAMISRLRGALWFMAGDFMRLCLNLSMQVIKVILAQFECSFTLGLYIRG